ncbi:MAG TPA: ferrous iron transport protein A [Cyanobacteria bacterium UBA11369]|nr:ferrous iron transport protein A [Cyanobacteria bacterium UBA11371]HBE33668.1 ferrous iron transport protein A [Cyanobacteria bacterium UBA11368]HBE50554.1 ferrous iron transport protein A [Cyanobacteria bacterium UBA11369]
MLTQGFTVCLSSLELLNPGEQGIVTRFSNTDETTIQQLKAMGIKPGMAIILEKRFAQRAFAQACRRHIRFAESHNFIVTDGDRRWELDKAMARAICVRLTHTK